VQRLVVPFDLAPRDAELDRVGLAKGRRGGELVDLLEDPPVAPEHLAQRLVAGDARVPAHVHLVDHRHQVLHVVDRPLVEVAQHLEVRLDAHRLAPLLQRRDPGVGHVALARDGAGELELAGPDALAEGLEVRRGADRLVQRALGGGRARVERVALVLAQPGAVVVRVLPVPLIHD
jgi:hypothetical protein